MKLNDSGRFRGRGTVQESRLEEESVRKIRVDQLRVGMYIENLNCAWFDHPFGRNRFRVSDAGMVERIRALGVEYVYIDTVLGDDLPPKDTGTLRSARSALPPAPAAPIRVQDFEPELRQPSKSVQEERLTAIRIAQDATRLITGLMHHVRLGHAVDAEPVHEMAGEIIGSVVRNSDALIGLGQARHEDRYTFEHSVGVAVLAASYAHGSGLPAGQVHELVVGGLLHDIGKSRVPDAILNKPGRLTEAEWQVMRRHVVDTREILERTRGIPAGSVAAAAQHHERYDGSGYPDGLAGDEIHPLGRILAICDVYDAITANRVYRRGQEPTGVLSRILRWSGSRFDATLVHQFIRCIGIYPVGTLVGMASQRLGVVIERGSRSLLHPVVRVFYDTRQARHISPEVIDLSADPDRDAIVSFEQAAQWGVDPHFFLF